MIPKSMDGPVTLGSNHCKCLLNQKLLAGSMTTAQRPSSKTK
jgi:hypothetical protein